MSEETTTTLLGRARRIQQSADRLVKLIELNAPDFVIEQERHLLGKKFISFPASAESIEKRERIDNEIYEKEQDHLSKTGYYDGIEP